jgi:hypothetical protein
LPTLLVIAAVVPIAVAWLQRFDPSEARLLAVALVARIAAVFLQVWITRDVYAGGDMLFYFFTGRLIADAMGRDFETWSDIAFDLVLQRDPGVPLFAEGIGTSTGTMTGLSAWALFITGGSLYASAMIFAFGSWVGTVCIYLVFRAHFEPEVRRRLLVASTLLPSVVYWTSGIQKEAVALAGMGPVLLGMHHWSEGRRIQGVALAAPGAFLVSLTKPYVLFALAIAAAVWLYWRAAVRATGGRAVRIRPLYLATASLAAAAAIALLGKIFPRFSIDVLGEEISRLQQVGQQVEGGSNYSLGIGEQRNFFGQIVFAPLALATSLFRPLPFEVRNAQMAANALETTVLVVLLLRAIAARSWARVWAEFRASPSLVFAAVFTAVFGIVIGLASTNLGSLSRYRVPLMPFFGALVLVVQTRRELPGVDRPELWPPIDRPAPLHRKAHRPIRPAMVPRRLGREVVR